MRKLPILPKRKLLNVTYIMGILCITSMVLAGCGDEQEPSPPLNPEEALERFVLADPELEIQLVASEPMVQDPVAISFDEGGRLWVVEMRGFMKDVDRSGELEKIGRISVLFDDDGDGKMDRSTIFLDSLVLPRALAVVSGGALLAENIPLWFAADTNGDFVADKLQLIDSTYGGSGMPEHSPNGLWRGMDNWYYNAKSSYRYRLTAGGWEKDSTETRGQWGITHDDNGRLYYNYNWSQLHADLVPPNALMANPNYKPGSGIDHGLTLDRSIYPIRSNPAANRGYIPGTLDEDGKLLEFTSACGPLVYRGTALPESYYGDAFVCEPTANLIKQNDVLEEGMMLRAAAVYDNQEFLASTDERFRPVYLSSGPDGALYIADMYKGLIQHGAYMTPYLRDISLERQLDSPDHMGRIWRITKKQNKPVQILPGNYQGRELIQLLNHENGWVRDVTQRLIVEQRDPLHRTLLDEQVRKGNQQGQLHALWALEGLGIESPEAIDPALDSPYPEVQAAAFRILQAMGSENKEASRLLSQFAGKSFSQATPRLKMQIVLGAAVLPQDQAFRVAREFLDSYGQLPLARDVVMAGLTDREGLFMRYLLQQGGWEAENPYRAIFLESLSGALLASGEEGDINYLLGFIAAGKETQEWHKTSLIQGMVQHSRMTEKPAFQISSMPELLQPEMAEKYLDSNAQQSLVQLFDWPGKPENPQNIEEAPEYDPAVWASGRKQYLNLCASCHGNGGMGIARFAPPLKDSEWVSGDEGKLALILLHGMEGPVEVNGKRYDIPDILPSMPSFSTLQDGEIAAIATYIRNAWGNQGEPVKRGTIGRIRIANQGKLTPWTAAELDTLSVTKNL